MAILTSSSKRLGLAFAAILLIETVVAIAVHAQQPPPPAGQGNLPAPAVPAGGVNVATLPAPQANPAAAGVPISAPGPMQVRIMDITYVQGDRKNSVDGIGLVTGLLNTGGRAEQTRIIAANYYRRAGIDVGTVETKNLSAVHVEGSIPPYARRGEEIQVRVSVSDDALSLRGGVLVETPLRGIDGEVYAIASGAVVVSGITAGGQGAALTVNHPTVGVVTATVEREIPCERIEKEGRLELILRNRSYGTANAIANALNNIFPDMARAMNQSTVSVIIPQAYRDNIPGFIAGIGNIQVTPDQHAKVVINQKTGTIIMGHRVRISNVVFASENIVISTTENPVASQPAPLSRGATVTLPRTYLDVVQSGGQYNSWAGNLTVGDLAAALNALGVSPNSLITIMTSLRNQGAIQAELIIE